MSELKNQTEKSSENSYVERFESERLTWTELIKEIASRFKNVEDLVNVQVDLYSQRQQAVEYTQYLTVLQSKIRKGMIAEWKKAYEQLSMNEDFRYNEREKSKMADEKISSIKMKSEIVQAHIDFFKESVKTIDNMIFGIKHRLDIEEFRHGNK